MPTQKPKAKPTTRPIGRPKLHERAKSSIVPVRFRAEDREKMEAAAQEGGVSVSEWIRKAIDAAL